MIRNLIRLALRVWVSGLTIRLIGMEHVPRTGAALVIGNHPSTIDGHLLFAVISRPFYFFARPENFSNPLFNWYTRTMGGRPVAVGGDNRSAMEWAEQCLRTGELFGILPESDVYPGATPAKFHGAFMKLALTCNVPIVPMVFSGTQHACIEPYRFTHWRHFILRRARVAIEFLPPITFHNPTFDRDIFARDVETVRHVIAERVMVNV